ncbi:MAG: preprotein translocase subunit SecE [Deltaproteobacteria bacterium]|nr:preprotein translocase subunit SecE [Deltaproteobacteria bacterium]
MKRVDPKSRKRGLQERSHSGETLQSVSAAHSPLSREGKVEKGRNNQASSKREPERKKEDKRSVLKYLGVAGQFLRESRMELKKVKWPSRKELLASTGAVIVLSLLVGVYLGIIDFALIKIVKGIVG